MWKTIETAPRDGTVILLCGGFTSNGRPAVRTAHWGGSRPPRWLDEVLGSCPREPTHWMPLLELPDGV